MAPFVRRLVDDILEVAEVPAARGASPTMRSGDSPTPSSATPAARWAPTGRASWPSACCPSSPPGCTSVCATNRFAVVVALWLAAVTRLPLAGVVLPDLDDPDADALRADVRDRGAPPPARVLGPAVTPAFAAEVVGTLEALEQRGLDVLREAT